jgi:hypothetical protein
MHGSGYIRQAAMHCTFGIIIYTCKYEGNDVDSSTVSD